MKLDQLTIDVQLALKAFVPGKFDLPNLQFLILSPLLKRYEYIEDVKLPMN
jgi:hypothetical protein